MPRTQVTGPIGEERKPKRTSREEIIAAFDEARAEAHELLQRCSEQVRAFWTKDRPADQRKK